MTQIDPFAAFNHKRALIAQWRAQSSHASLVNGPPSHILVRGKLVEVLEYWGSNVWACQRRENESILLIHELEADILIPKYVNYKDRERQLKEA